MESFFLLLSLAGLSQKLCVGKRFTHGVSDIQSTQLAADFAATDCVAMVQMICETLLACKRVGSEAETNFFKVRDMNVPEQAVAGTRAAEASAAGGAESNAKKIADVALTSFVVYRVQHAGKANQSIKVLAGGLDARFDDDGRVQLLAGNVPFRADSFKNLAPRAGSGMLALYGHRDALEELQYWRNFARANDAEFAYVNYNVVVDKILPMLVDRELLRNSPDVRFLNVRRMKSSLQVSVLQRFQNWVAEEGDLSSMTLVAEIANRPDLWDRIFDEDEDFQHLSVLVVPVADDPEVIGKMRQLAYIRPGAKVNSVVQGTEQVDVLLPLWLTDESVAKEIRPSAA